MKKDLLTGVVIVALSVLCGLDLRTVKDPEIIKNQIGVTVFPWIMVAALALLGGMLIIFSLVKMRQGGQDKKPFDWGQFRQMYAVPILMFCIVSAYIFLTPVIGFYVMSLVFFVSLGLLLGGFTKKNILTISIGSIATVAAVYLIFQVMLQVWMPQGILF